MIHLTTPIDEINFPIGTTTAAALLNRHVVTVNEHLRALKCPKLGKAYLINRETLLELTKRIGKSKKKKNFHKKA